MKLIHLSQSKIAVVDDEDFNTLSKYQWHAKVHRNTVYARTNMLINGKRRPVSMHRIILGIHDPKIMVDHINGNGFDNRKENLRIVTNAVNLSKVQKHKDNKSGFLGVFWCGQKKKWAAKITILGKQHHAGFFIDKVMAAKARDKKAFEIVGQTAKLNFPLGA